MRTQKSLDVHRIRSASDACFYGAGIPSTHWNPVPGTYRCRVFKIGESGSMISPETQSEFIQKLLTDPTVFSAPETVYVCAREHESLALSLTYDILKAALASKRRIQIDNAASEYEYDSDIPVAALVNVSDTGTVDRRQRIRDWLHDYNAAFKVLACAADPEKLTAYLDIKPTLAFFVTANTVVRT